jgi:hypothetical protein
MDAGNISGVYCIFRAQCGFECAERLEVEVRKEGKYMLIVTTLYCMELETAKKLAAEKPAEESAVSIPLDDREFLGIYQGQSRVKPNEQ